MSSASDPTPIDLQRDGDAGISIQWSDDSSTHWTAKQLRDACPCATCREKKRAGEKSSDAPGKMLGLPVLSAAEARPLAITSMRPVGAYAYNISFSDGHSSGIFQLSMLHHGPG